MKQTAVEWLIETHFGSIENCTPDFRNKIKQAIKMEKQQMWEYIKTNYVNGENSLSFHKKEFEQYYKETFKQD
jgi:hypothetical protein